MKAIPVDADNQKFQDYAEKQFKKVYLDGFTNGAKTSSEIVYNLLKDFNEENYKEKINEVLRICSPKIDKEKGKTNDNK